ncbi:hypothetical protein GCM10029976_031980 [Kribbella albertanoniae]|uniref:Uncharacterized protein n=1 Tax=Kribbella albertanoniae TaxID=1266829 RepID=A0A4R4QHG3_9ACTN|nr:hypothetical protein [Kribbella albertanoniae]TDC34990.1 hypothetical protein E1261_02075 [Kribbella albertanoniae]
MRGTKMYAFEIATRGRGGEWVTVASGLGVFSRAPKPTVRSIAERWIHEQTGRLRGGRLIVVGRRRAAPRGFVPSVRIRLTDRAGDRPLASAYIGVDRRDVVRRDGYELPTPTGADRG